MGKEHFLVTGAQGCIGAWVIKNLVEMGHPVTAFDIDDRPARISLLVPPDALKKVHFVRGDISDLNLLQCSIFSATGGYDENLCHWFRGVRKLYRWDINRSGIRGLFDKQVDRARQCDEQARVET